VVLLHGFGAPGDDLVALWRTLSAPPGTRFVFPEAPLDLAPLGYPRGARAWWLVDLEARLRRQALGEPRDVAEVPEGLEAARSIAIGLIDDVERELRPPAGKLVLGGFSQGAMLSLDVALHVRRALAGVVLMSGTHIAADAWATLYAGRRGLPVFMSHGQADELLPFDVSEGLRDTLVANGLPVQWVPFRGGHGIAPNVVTGVGEFLNRVLALL
jgi:phospholipase/carboxylesterase